MYNWCSTIVEGTVLVNLFVNQHAQVSPLLTSFSIYDHTLMPFMHAEHIEFS